MVDEQKISAFIENINDIQVELAAIMTDSIIIGYYGQITVYIENDNEIEDTLINLFDDSKTNLTHEGYINPVTVHQEDIFRAGQLFANCEGVIPAPETCHAIKATIDQALKCKETDEEKTIVVNFSGHGLMDLKGYETFIAGELENAK